MTPTLNRLRDTFLDLVQIPSPSRNERAVVDEIRRRVEALGYDAEEDNAGELLGGNAGNLLVRVPATAGGGAKVLVAAHVDTVEAGDVPIRPCVEGDDILSDGTSIVGADDKTGVAAMLEVLARLKEENWRHGELLFAFTVCEEIECLGAGVLDPKQYEGYDAGVALDHSVPNEIIVGAPTKVAVRMELFGHGGHGAHPETRVNAAHAMATLASRLPSGRLDAHTTANLGILRSGTAINIIPERATAEWEVRSHRKDVLDYHLKRALTIVEGAVREARTLVLGADTGLGGDKGDPDDPVRRATIDVEVETCYEAYRHDETAVPVQFLTRAIEAAGLVPEMVIAQGGSDANILNRRGLPTAVLGCGMHGAHAVSERATLSEMGYCVEVLLRTVATPQDDA